MSVRWLYWLCIVVRRVHWDAQFCKYCGCGFRFVSFLVSFRFSFHFVSRFTSTHVKGWQSVCWKSLRMWPWFRTTQNMRIWSFRKMAMRCLCFLRTSQLRLWLRLRSLSLLPFLRQSLSSFFLAHVTILPIWHCNNETTTFSTATENDKLTQAYTTWGYFTCILSGMDVCTQATPLIALLKQDEIWGHTPPFEGTICKIRCRKGLCEVTSEKSWRTWKPRSATPSLTSHTLYKERRVWLARLGNTDKEAQVRRICWSLLVPASLFVARVSLLFTFQSLAFYALHCSPTHTSVAWRGSVGTYNISVSHKWDGHSWSIGWCTCSCRPC